jgi:hypothetical protein
MLLKPAPDGVVMGAFSAMPFFLTDSIVACGSGVPVLAIMSIPASATSHLMPAFVASIHLLAACAISGPTPSPVIRVTVVISKYLHELTSKNAVC